MLNKLVRFAHHWNNGMLEYSIIPCGLQTKMTTKITVIAISYINFDTLKKQGEKNEKRT
jgi:hypothetical protein